MQNSLDPESKITLGNLSPERLSPNLFIGINIDAIDTERHHVSMDWTNFVSAPNIATGSSHPQYHKLSTMTTHMDEQQSIISATQSDHSNSICSSIAQSSHLLDLNSCLHLDNTVSTYDEMRYLTVDNFNMENFKNDCIELNMDQTIVLNDKTMAITHALLDAEAHNELDMQSAFTIEDKSSPLLDLENPVMNIHVEGMSLQ